MPSILNTTADVMIRSRERIPPLGECPPRPPVAERTRVHPASLKRPPNRREILVADGEFSVRKEEQDEQPEAGQMAALRSMACYVSHSLRHSLSAIFADAEFCEYPKVSAHDRSVLLGEVREAVLEMTELLDALVLFVRTGQTLQLRRDQVSSVVERAVAAVKKHPDGRKVLITLAPLSPVAACIDPRKVASAIYNLLLNACQAALWSGRPQVKLLLEEDGERILVTVVDNGPGVPEAIRATLFEPFVTANKHNGTGLGLTLAHQIAQEHGGRVCLDESHPGRTVFILELAKEARGL